MRRRRLLSAPPPASSAGLDIGALAPMVDMMTLLLVFLMRSYATDPAPAPPQGSFHLAATLSEDARRPALEILVSSEAIYVEGSRVIATPYLPEELLVREIYDRLLATRDKARPVEIHADAAIPYGALKRILHTAKAA